MDRLISENKVGIAVQKALMELGYEPLGKEFNAIFTAIGNVLEEEQGLPCKVGDKVYVIAPNYNKCENLYECEEYDSERYLVTWCQTNCPKGFGGIGVVETKVTRIEITEGDIYLRTDRCGLRNTKNIFLTKEAAEQVFAEMQKGV